MSGTTVQNASLNLGLVNISASNGIVDVVLLPPSITGQPLFLTARVVDRAATTPGLLRTTEVMIADAPKDEGEHNHGPPGGGMPEMGM